MRIIDSVAAVFCCGDQIFSVRRQSYLDAFPGFDAFPGGKIDREDSADQHPSPLLSSFDGKKIHALLREMREELAYDIEEGIATGQVVAVHYLATALAPPLSSVRFRLHFFRIDLLARPAFVLDKGEIADGCWQTPGELLTRFHAGDSLMVPPMRWLLKGLERNPDAAEIGDLSPQFEEERLVPELEFLSELSILAVPSSTFPPVKRTNAFLLGDGQGGMILIDPSPESPQVLEKLLRTLEPYRISALFITHHHRDHCEQLPELARHFGVPVWMSPYTLERLIEREGEDYLLGIEVVCRGEGDLVGSWKGEKIRVYEVPGHDAGQLALAPESLRWFIAGDLIQSVGSVVIPPREGDMATYFQTLESIIDLAPEVVFPSHGTPMRSVCRLAETLQHRRNREEEIRALHQSGKSQPQILDAVYGSIDDRLHPFALMNIESHLAKLRREGRL